MKKLNANDIRDIIVYISYYLIDKASYLDELDSKTGDGEHGSNFKKGLKTLLGKIENKDFTDIGTLLKTTGLTIFSSGSGAGPGYIGYGIMKASSLFSGKAEASKEEFADFFLAMKDYIQAKGGAKIGDRTLIDALEPATLALLRKDKDMFKNAYEKAKKGVESTKELTPKKGRSFHLGDRIIGVPDPGAMSIAFIFEAISKYQEENCRDT